MAPQQNGPRASTVALPPMNRNPGRPKFVMRPCTCASKFQACNCEWMRTERRGAVKLALCVIAGSVLVIWLWYFLRG